MPKPVNSTGLKRLLNAFSFSIAGFKACIKSEEAFRQEVWISGLLIPLGFLVGETAVEKILLIGSILLLFIIELLNTAIERAIDRISYDHHELSRDAKDMGSAAVLFGIILAVLVWSLIISENYAHLFYKI